MQIDEHKKWFDAKCEQFHARLDRANRIMAEERQLRLLIQELRTSIEACRSAKK